MTQAPVLTLAPWQLAKLRQYAHPSGPNEILEADAGTLSLEQLGYVKHTRETRLLHAQLTTFDVWRVTPEGRAALALIDGPEKPKVALSCTQPWAWLMVNAPPKIAKRIENRKWHLPDKYRGALVYLHAAKGMTKADYQAAYETTLQIGATIAGTPLADMIPPPGALVKGAIIGQMRFVDCRCPPGVSKSKFGVPHAPPNPWHFHGQHGFEIRDVTMFETPVPCLGALGMWEVDDELRARLP